MAGLPVGRRQPEREAGAGHQRVMSESKRCFLSVNMC